MYLFGHLGIGLKLVSPWSRKLPKKLILLGTILPDVLDKTLYYTLSWITGKSGADLGVIAGTRSFGHTALLLMIMTVTASLFRFRWLAAICLGVASHLLLDNLSDRLIYGPGYTAKTLLWPLLSWTFPPYRFHGVWDHLSQIHEPYFLIAEIVGALILMWEYWKERKRREIARWIIEGRSIAQKPTKGRSRDGRNF